jgi:xanthine dehydrogenase accessory factor
MLNLDLQVISSARNWCDTGHTFWLCTVLGTFGSSPRAPGSIMIARKDGMHVGSLSGGCVEDDFLTRLSDGEFEQSGSIVRYGEAGSNDSPNIRLPCGGILEVLIQRMLPSEEMREHMAAFERILCGNSPYYRRISLDNFEEEFVPAQRQGDVVQRLSQPDQVLVRIGPVSRLIIAGISSVSTFCAQFAVMIGFEVIVCDVREIECQNFQIEGVQVINQFPADFIVGKGNVHKQTAIIAVTHDPRIDDLALMEAVLTPAFYIGVMGSYITSQKRAERLKRSGGFDDKQLSRIHMPIGLALGSKTPAEIGLAVVADILRVQRGRDKKQL